MRAEDDPDYQYMVDGIRDIEEMRARKSVSLNIDTRRQEREETRQRRLARENERRAALGLEALESVDELESVELPDVQLNEAADIVTDMAEFRELGVAPTHTAASVRNRADDAE